MADGTHIEWCDATWQPITGCSVVSPGCTNCYAMRLAGTRLRTHPSRIGLTHETKAGPVWTGEVRFNEKWLDQPLRWTKPRRIFVCAHGDLFAEGVPDEWIDRVFAVMALAPQHIFLVLTKRAARMREWFERDRKRSAPTECLAELYVEYPAMAERWPFDKERAIGVGLRGWPLPNVWLGVSVEDQARADERIRELLATPAAKWFISAEPLLAYVDLREHLIDHLTDWMVSPKRAIDWVIVGGESGPGARPMHPDWARALRDQCAAAGVAFFHKQNGEFASVSEIEGVGEHYHFPDGTTVRRVGKRAAGRLLDGAEHSEFPA